MKVYSVDCFSKDGRGRITNADKAFPWSALGYYEEAIQSGKSYLGTDYFEKVLSTDLPYADVDDIDVCGWGTVKLYLSSRAKEVLSRYVSEVCFHPVKISGRTWYILWPPEKTGTIDDKNSGYTHVGRGPVYIDQSRVSAGDVFVDRALWNSIFVSEDVARDMIDSGLRGFVFSDFIYSDRYRDSNEWPRGPLCSVDIAEREKEAIRAEDRLKLPYLSKKATIAEIAKVFGFPRYYREFLQNFPEALRHLPSSGPDPSRKIAKVELLGSARDVAELNRELWEDAYTKWLAESESSEWPREYIAIGSDMRGNYFLIKANEESPAVWFYDHDEGEICRRFAHLSEFVEELMNRRLGSTF